jgi:hypothetical protein
VPDFCDRVTLVVRLSAELGNANDSPSTGADPLSVEASRVCMLADSADGLALIAQHAVDHHTYVPR